MSDLLAAGLLLATLAPFLACALRYSRSPWRDSELGRALMLLFGSISAVLMLGVIARLTDPEHPITWVARVLLLAAVQVAGWLIYRQITRYQRETPADVPRRRATDL